MVAVEPEGDSLLRKVRLILDAFDTGAPVLGLSELARRTALAKTTVHRVATDMVGVGLLNRRDRRYELGALLFQLGQRVPRTRGLRLIAARYLEDLAISTRETVVLAFPGDRHVLFAEKYFSQRGGGVAVTHVEGRVPFHCGASGKALLAFGDESTRESVMRAPLRRRTPWTITDPSRLRAEIEEVRRQGYAIDRQELVVGYGAVAAPVFAQGVAVATLTVVGPVDRMDVRRVAPMVTAAGRALTRDVEAVNT
ncbi:IclR family transcriptional regulator [Streptomyces sp. S465]|uniref:IclR family transcriptional regulator n=1 Tax=Streptomyces sp. S465 TaxID=2979468 RepID=UPI0022A88636|nr:IclR family transcriptional regulator [Streptomyces sp. S465]WAP53899.1 IclR family transcriptional regulator [Streptomyces sp. S465]